jgi:hypothetical protein
MCWHGLKDTTKDADIVFLTKREAEAFRKALLDSRFIENEIVSLDDGYADMNTFGIFDEVRETPLDEDFTPGLRVDVFLRRVCGVFEFSERMRKRSVEGFKSGKMNNMICAPEDVFLFKSITTREKDITDMMSLHDDELDWKIVEDELKAQIQNLGQKRGVEYLDIISQRWTLLEEEHRKIIPIAVKSLKI